MAKKIRVWDGTQWQDVAPSLPYTAIHSAQASMPLTGVDGQVWLDTDGTLAGQDFVPLSGGTMTGNLNVPSINSGGISGQNHVINGGFDFWQRGTSFSLTSTTYTADRFVVSSTSSSSASRSTDVPTNNYSRYSLSVTSDQWANGIYTLIENGALLVNGRTYTFSAWVKGPAGKTANISIGWQGEASSYTFTGSWQYITRTITFANTFRSTNGGGDTLYLHFVRAVGGTTLASGDTVLITQCKMEEGSQATPFVRSGYTLSGELAACQRYYYRTSKSGGSAGIGPVFYNGNSNAGYGILNLPVSMRIPPSSIEFSGLTMLQPGITTFGVSNVALANERTENVVTFGTTSSGGMANGNAYFLFASSGGYLAVSAEL